MSRFIFCLLIYFPFMGYGQNFASRINIEVKPVDPKNGYELTITKFRDNIQLIYRKIDSIGKVPIAKEDRELINRLVTKDSLDSAESEQLHQLEKQIESLKKGYTFYKTDTIDIYKSTHKNYWQFLETIFQTPDEILTKKLTNNAAKDATFCFFTLDHPQQKLRYLLIESLDVKTYPLLVKLVNDTDEIVRSYRQAMKRKN